MRIRLLYIMLLMMMATGVSGLSAHAAESTPPLHIAVAANFTMPMKRLIAEYAAQTGKTVTASYGSTGMLYGQITNGAPFTLFFAADEKRPELLFEQGLANKPVRYALGEVVLFSRKEELRSVTTWQNALSGKDIRRVAIASPKTAPYGAAAIVALNASKLYDSVAELLVYGKNVGQAFQFVDTKAADVGFVAKSQAIAAAMKDGQRSLSPPDSKSGYAAMSGSEEDAHKHISSDVMGLMGVMGGMWWTIPEAPQVAQAACIVTGVTPSSAEAVKEAEDFLNFVLGPAGDAVRADYGYR